MWGHNTSFMVPRTVHEQTVTVISSSTTAAEDWFATTCNIGSTLYNNASKTLPTCLAPQGEDNDREIL